MPSGFHNISLSVWVVHGPGNVIFFDAYQHLKSALLRCIQVFTLKAVILTSCTNSDIPIAAYRMVKNANQRMSCNSLHNKGHTSIGCTN